MRKFKVDLKGVGIFDKEFRADELSKHYGFNPTQSRKICRALNETAKQNSGSGSMAAARFIPGHDEDVSIDGRAEDTSDFSTAAPGPRTVKKSTI